jgi:two-component system sensor histidine kinase HydH
MKKINEKTNWWVGISPWIILGAVLVLTPLFVFMTLANINRQKENTTKLLLEKGAALIRSFEAGARTGMMGMQWGGFQVQRLLTETAQQPDIIYLMVTDSEGRILAHDDPSKIGMYHGRDLDLKRLSGSKDVNWRQVTGQDGTQIFEVFRQFAPTRGRDPGHRGEMRRRRTAMDDWCRPHMTGADTSYSPGQVIFVGLDMGSVEAARREDMHHSVIMAIAFLVIGFAGIVSLFLVQAYRTTKTSLYRLKAFSDNLVENMPMGLVAIDMEGKIASFNQTAESIFQLSAGEVLGKAPEQVLPQSLSEIIGQVKANRGIIEREINCPVKGDKTIPLEVIATFLEEEYGRFLGYVMLLRDLTQIQDLKREVQRNQRLASIGRLAAGVAHEIRNPLSSIKGFATYFKERYRQVPEDQKTAEVMIQEVERLNRVISQLLEFASPMSIQEKPTSLRALIQHSIKLIEGDAHKKGIGIHTDISPEINDVMIDPDRFKQVLLNLYLNSIEAMGKGGTLSVRVQREETERDILINISDTGVGIREEDLPNIFDPYFTSKSSGTGLGLAIVLKIVESHGGKVGVKSRPGEGTTVTITLPFSSEV